MGAQLGLGARTGGELERHWIDDLKVVFNAEIAVNEPPSVVITSPTDGSNLTVGATAKIQVTAQDKENQITKVEFLRTASSSVNRRPLLIPSLCRMSRKAPI